MFYFLFCLASWAVTKIHDLEVFKYKTNFYALNQEVLVSDLRAGKKFILRK